MICKKCMSKNPSKNKVCSNCGAVLRKEHRLSKFGGLFAVLVLGIIIFVFNAGFLNPKYEVPDDKKTHPVIYTKDNALGIKPVSKSPNVLSDFLMADTQSGEAPNVVLSENGAGLYFLEGYNSEVQSGSLFASYNGKTKLPVSSNAYGGVKASPNGKYALFAENPNMESMTGTLYVYEKNSEKEKISGNVYLDGFEFGRNSSDIFYIESPSAGGGDLYTQKIGGEREKIDSGVYKIVNVLKSSAVLYLKQKEGGKYDLYYWRHGQSARLVGENVPESMIYSAKLSDNFYYFIENTDGGLDLYFSDSGKTGKLIDIDVSAPVIYDANYNNIIYTSISDAGTSVYIKRKNKQPALLNADSESLVSCSYDFKTVVYVADVDSETGLGKLYMKKYSIFGDKETLVAEDVADFVFSRKSGTILYSKGTQTSTGSDLYMYKNKKNTLVAEGILPGNYYLTNNATGIFYISSYNEDKDSGNLFYKKVSKPKAEGTKINSDVSRSIYPRGENQVVYTKNYLADGTSELYIWKNKKSELIDSGNISILFE